MCQLTNNLLDQTTKTTFDISYLWCYWMRWNNNQNNIAADKLWHKSDQQEEICHTMSNKG